MGKLDNALKRVSMNVMILGAGGGIGRALLEEYMSAPGITRIYATHHCEVSSTSSLVRWLHLDMSDPESIMALADQVDQPIHRWISCTGILAGDHGQPEKTLRQLSSDKLQFDYQVNALGPLTAFSSLANHLRSDDMRAVFLSAQVGSIEDNRLGGWYGYRMSKAALNMGVRCLAIECARWRSAPLIVAVHPGTTVTNLSRAFTKTRKTPVQSAAACAMQLKALVESLDSDQTGQFLKLDGQTLPW